MRFYSASFSFSFNSLDFLWAFDMRADDVTHSAARIMKRSAIILCARFASVACVRCQMRAVEIWAARAVRRVSALCAAPGAGLENFGTLVVCGLRRMRQLSKGRAASVSHRLRLRAKITLASVLLPLAPTAINSLRASAERAAGSTTIFIYSPSHAPARNVRKRCRIDNNSPSGGI